MKQDKDFPQIVALHLINVEVPEQTNMIVTSDGRIFVETELPPHVLPKVDRFFTQDCERSLVAVDKIEYHLRYDLKSDPISRMLLEDLRKLFISFLEVNVLRGVYNRPPPNST